MFVASFLPVGVCFKLLSSQVLVNESKGMDIIAREIGSTGRAVRNPQPSAITSPVGSVNLGAATQASCDEWPSVSSPSVYHSNAHQSQHHKIEEIHKNLTAPKAAMILRTVGIGEVVSARHGCLFLVSGVG